MVDLVAVAQAQVQLAERVRQQLRRGGNHLGMMVRQVHLAVAVERVVQDQQTMVLRESETAGSEFPSGALNTPVAVAVGKNSAQREMLMTRYLAAMED
jgi:hypothetical protein